MNVFSIVMVSIGIAMDAFAVSISSGVVLKKQFNIKNVLKIGLIFSVFQALMPLIGWVFGSSFSSYIETLDHWVVFILLAVIGIKMIYDSFDEEKKQTSQPMKTKMLMGLALATSIDALAVGLSFAFLEVSILFLVICIGTITFLLTAIGVMIGNFSGERLKKKAGIFGGILLLLIGTRVLLDHLNMF
jgi:manganese efflux pump family protein